MNSHIIKKKQQLIGCSHIQMKQTLLTGEGVLEVKEELAAAVYSCIIISPEKRTKQLIVPCL